MAKPSVISDWVLSLCVWLVAQGHAGRDFCFSNDTALAHSVPTASPTLRSLLKVLGDHRAPWLGKWWVKSASQGRSQMWTAYPLLLARCDKSCKGNWKISTSAVSCDSRGQHLNCVPQSPASSFSPLDAPFMFKFTSSPSPSQQLLSPPLLLLFLFLLLLFFLLLLLLFLCPPSPSSSFYSSSFSSSFYFSFFSFSFFFIFIYSFSFSFSPISWCTDAFMSVFSSTQ